MLWQAAENFYGGPSGITSEGFFIDAKLGRKLGPPLNFCSFWMPRGQLKIATLQNVARSVTIPQDRSSQSNGLYLVVLRGYSSSRFVIPFAGRIEIERN